MLGVMTAGVAHELNNPAAAAQRAAEQLIAQVSNLAALAARGTDSDVVDLLTVLGERGRVTFRDLTRECTTKIDVVVRFLALLELYKRGEADLDQAETFGQITVSRTDRTSDGDAVILVDEYEGVPVSDIPAGSEGAEQ